jgi:SAM-dependent methyltransferase
MLVEKTSRGFQEPRHVTSLADCHFYHSIELPGLGLQVGEWDLRDDVEAYLGRQSFDGKTVVDVGCASGFVSFELEKRGASVISFDRSPDDRTDDAGLIPFDDYAGRFGVTLEEQIERRRRTQIAMQNSYWLAHRVLGSRARLYCGNAYEGMPGVEPVDVSLFGCILLHLRDPLLALTKFARQTARTLIVTEMHEDVGGLEVHPIMVLRASLVDRGNKGSWWAITPAVLRQFLQVLGFRRFEYATHAARMQGEAAPIELYTLVAHR